MSDADWDNDDFEPNLDLKPKITKGKWEGEDEDDDVKDNWDDDEEEKEEALKTEAVAVPAKKKKTLKEKIAEKEDQRKKEIEQKMEKKQVFQQKVLTPKQIMEEKLKRQKELEQQDLELALEALGLDKSAAKNAGEIDSFEPITGEDFTKFASLLTTKIENYKNSPWYTSFLENLFRDLVAGVDMEGMKKITSSLSVMYNEKLKLTKAKPKKKATKAKLNMGREADVFDGDVDGDDFGYDDDFM